MILCVFNICLSFFIYFSFFFFFVTGQPDKIYEKVLCTEDI